MGRPLKKKYFGTGAGTKIKVRAKIGANAEGYGFIVAQKGTNKFRVTVGSDTAVCKLVDKANGALAAGEMTISVTDGTTVSKILNVKNHTVKFGDGSIHSWKFDAAAGSFLQMEKTTDTFSGPLITITTQPVNATVVAGATATFTVAATATQGATRSYQWQVQTGGTGSWTNQTNGAGYTNATTASMSIVTTSPMNTNKYRCVVSATGGATSVNSSSATLTVS